MQIEYTVTVAVCTKTSPQNLQILRKNTQKVFASPSRRRMDSKGDSEEITYPSLYFAIDDFEQVSTKLYCRTLLLQVFSDVAVRDGECVCVELVARDQNRSGFESAIFLGSIRYEVLKQVYDTKASSSQARWHGWASRLSLVKDERRKEFVRMRGPHGKGEKGNVFMTGTNSNTRFLFALITDCRSQPPVAAVGLSAVAVY